MARSGKLVSVGDAAGQLQVSPGTVRNWIDKGYIRAVRLPSGHRKVPEAEISKLLGKMFELAPPVMESDEPAPRRRRSQMPPDEWGQPV